MLLALGVSAVQRMYSGIVPPMIRDGVAMTVKERIHQLIDELDDGALRVSTRLHLDELSERLDVELEDDDVDTVGGLLAKHLGRVPIPGAQVWLHGVELTAESAQGRRNRIGTVSEITAPLEAE